MSDTVDAGSAGGRRKPAVALTTLVVVAVVGFLAAYQLAGGDGETAPAGDEPAEAEEAEEAGDGATDDDRTDEDVPAPEYDIDVVSDPEPPVIEGTEFSVTVTEDGAPVTGADVRIDLEMTQHAHAGVHGDGEETDAGVYVVPVEFVMRGLWEGSVRVEAPGEPRATEGLSYHVQ